ncbi:MAG: hypothetical protein ONB13_04835 [candidate division KSB1 bacterium]|nr:hypothetical protein [candidate division KSB1 bacterium]
MAMIDPYLLLVILLSLYIPLIGVNLYFRYDDAGTLLWALDFKKGIIHAFDPAPWFDEYNFYNGVGGYYRPFESLYIMLLVKIFGPEPFYFHLINGILVITTIVFMYRIAVLLSGSRLAGLMSAAVFHLAFQSILYGTFHVVVPFGFFFELITFYLFIKGLNQSKFRTIALGFLFLIPATNRQTTALILTAIVIVFFIMRWRESKFNLWERIAIFLMASVPNLLIPFTKNSSHATILSQPFSVAGYWQYILERLSFYTNLMTSHLPGVIIISTLFLFWLTNLPVQRLWPKINSRWVTLLAIPLSLMISFMALKIQPIAVVVLYGTLAYLFIADRSLQSVIVWFAVSLTLFSIINFYHDAYFLEAAFALAIVLGYLLYRSAVKIQSAFDVLISPRLERGILTLAAVGIISFGTIAWRVPGLPIISAKVEAVKILIETNQNFKRMFEYLASELPPNAKVFRLSEEYLGLTMNQRRFLPLRERAENVKVINILDSNVMIKVLGRWDIEFKHAEGLTLGIPENCVFIVHNKLEKRIAMQKFQLEPIREFKNHNTEAGVYRVIALKEPL